MQYKETSTTISLPQSVLDRSESNYDGDLKWYMEKFATEDPFETTKGARVSQLVRKLASDLLNALSLHTLVDAGADDTGPRHIILHVLESVGNNSSAFQRIRWEVLEKLDALPSKWHVSGLTVVRVVVAAARDPGNDNTAVDHSSPKPVRRILALTARPKGVADIPHRLITKPIFSTVQAVKKEQAANIEFEIIRPGTFEALEVKLESEKPGHYPAVHLDLHGSVDENG